MAHPGGRPLKFSTVDSILENSDVFIEDVESIQNKSFSKEKVLVDYILLNIESFCKDFLNDELVGFETEFEVEQIHRPFSPRRRRVDIMVKGKKKIYLIECKNPKFISENRSAVGQLLSYGIGEYLDSERELLLITTMYDSITAQIIRKYNIPMRYIYLDKNRVMEYLRTIPHD